MRVTTAELRHITWQQLGIRVALTATSEQMMDLLSYKMLARDLPTNPVNALRQELKRFIQENRDQLSLACDGDCDQHPDGMVLHCHTTLKEG